MSQAQQGLSCIMAHAHMLADLNEVGQMGADMEDVLPSAVIHLVCQKLDVYGLQDPGRYGLQIFQENIADHVAAIQDLPLGRCIQAEVRKDPVL